MERKHQGRQIRAQIRTRAIPQQVWEAWTDPWGKPLPQALERRLRAALGRLAGELGDGAGAAR
ncbi:MAG: hypothetical protein WAU32_09165 [Thermoanaerobaculia bacterium]